MTTGGVSGWDLALPTTSLVLPTGGSQTPRSGTTVIGGPLPQPLTAAGITGNGIIWYSPVSDPAGAWTNINYQFLVNGTFNASPNVAAILMGYVDTGNVAHLMSNVAANGAATRGQNFSIFGANGDGFIYWDTSVCQQTMTIGNNNTRAAIAIGPTLIRGSAGGDGYASTNSGLLDKWQSFTISGSFGGRTYTGNIDYRLTFDRVVDLRCTVNFSAATTTAGTLVMNAVPLAVQSDASPSGLRVIYGGWSSNLTTGSASTNAAAGQIALFNIGVNTTVVTTQFTYTIPKPTF